MTCTKEKIIDSIYEKCDLPKTNSTQIMETLLELIKRALESREDVLVSGFGKFYLQDKRERRGRNPHNGEKLMLSERRIVTFRCSSSLRDKVNGR